MTLDFSRDKQQALRDNRYEQIDEWFGDKSVHAWKKCLFALYRYGPMNTGEIARQINISMSVTYRRLKKQVLDSKVKGKMENNKLIWCLTDHGNNSISKLHERKQLPEFLFEEV